MLAVETRINELERQLQAAEAEEVVDAELDLLTDVDVDGEAGDVFAAYARTLTTALPVIRSAFRVG